MARYEIVSWVGGARDQMWKTWGMRRARRVADDVINDYRARAITDYEVGIFDSRQTMHWYASADRERQGLGPLTEPVV